MEEINSIHDILEIQRIIEERKLPVKLVFDLKPLEEKYSRGVYCVSIVKGYTYCSCDHPDFELISGVKQLTDKTYRVTKKAKVKAKDLGFEFESPEQNEE